MSVKISCWASYFTQKKSVFLARTWHAHAFPGILAFLLSQPSHVVVGNGGFSTRKKGEKATFTECHASKQQRTFKNVGRISKKVRRFSENVGEKKKNVGAFLKETPTFFHSLSVKVVKAKSAKLLWCARVWRGHWWKTETLRSNCIKRPAICDTNSPNKNIDGFAHPCASAQMEDYSQPDATWMCQCFGALSNKKPQKTTHLTSILSRTRHTITFYVTFSAIFLSLPSYPPIYY